MWAGSLQANAASQAAAGATRRPRVVPHAHAGTAPWGATRRGGGGTAAAAASAVATRAAACCRHRPRRCAGLAPCRAAGGVDAGELDEEEEEEQQQQARRRAKGAGGLNTADLPPVMPEAVVLFEGESDVNGVIQIHEVPHAEGIPEEIQGTRLLYVGAPPRLMGAYRAIGDPHPLTYAVWDFMATFPVLLDEGPIGIFGWGGGTVARLFAEVYNPPPPLVAWEFDPRVVEASRIGFGLAEVSEAAGIGEVQIGDPLEAAAPEGGYAGIVVDLFVAGQLPPVLVLDATWRAIRSKLSDPAAGRVIARLGPATKEDGSLVPQAVLALNAMAAAFDGEVSFIDPPVGSQLDVLALTGPLPDRREWAQAVGPVLAPYTVDWEPWEIQEIDAREFPELFEDFEVGDEEEGEEAGPEGGGEEGAGGAAQGGAAAEGRQAAADRRR
ncbi:hypothetical protein Rsub_01208 [Raphidocelis subcapitata]|uniref:Spermidine synthase n=1 Tax=Raphidocelis subcapitata TaxID=307507 RepID=A0A2V0NUJ4_9CHLO|nr:hypothetical protein Rsub_01208 [Raphidocelis subcapitata]|eukprot:GBF88495.1 hypothetical protein Rsub_01208 [Raphidocelis subcapitata]